MCVCGQIKSTDLHTANTKKWRERVRICVAYFKFFCLAISKQFQTIDLAKMIGFMIEWIANSVEKGERPVDSIFSQECVIEG